MRKEVTQLDMAKAMGSAQDWLFTRIQEKGNLSFASVHEMSGVVSEEYRELCQAIDMKLPDMIEHELKDIIVACLFGLACLKSGKLNR